jgi:hypothetical protein
LAEIIYGRGRIVTSIRTSTITAAILLGTFALLMTVGFHLRHGEWIWEAMSHV